MAELKNPNDADTVGDIMFHVGTYRLFQEGMSLLKSDIETLEKQLQSFKITASPFEKEKRDLETMIKWGADRLAKTEYDYDDIHISGASYGSLRYLKAGALIAADHYESEKTAMADKGMLSPRMVESIDAKVKLLKEKANQGVLGKLNPSAIYDEVKSLKNRAANNFIIANETFPATPQKPDGHEYKCFVIMPIGKRGSPEYLQNMEVYEKIVEKCVSSTGYKIKCYHADLINEPGAIPSQIINSLSNDEIVIADLRRSNRNVIWELGVRHALRKRSIMIYSDDQEAFFDTSMYRMAQYHLDGQSNLDFFNRIREFIDHIIQNPSHPDNPVWENYYTPPAPVAINKKTSVTIDFSALSMEQSQHKYLFGLALQNQSDEMLKNVIAEVRFPSIYMEKQDWNYPHLSARQENINKLAYTLLTFNFGALPEAAQRQFEAYLLPQKTLWLFGKPEQHPIARLEYNVDDKNWEERHNYNVSWTIYVDGKIISQDSAPFDSIQKF